MSKEVRFITKNFYQYDTSSIDSYMSIGGFKGLARALREAVEVDPRVDGLPTVKGAL